ncbi:MAG: hypothetical protein QOG23_2358 [Blastocatellia bacterium]|jgi:hypothetical protein|nr:hypothetical protein [Blastocatellia bacterium]
MSALHTPPGTPSINSHLLGHKPIAPIERGPTTGDCKPKFQQTPKKRPRVKPYSSVIQGNCTWHSACNRSGVEVGLKLKRTIRIERLV